MSAPETPRPTRSWRAAPRWLKIAFAASLALNFLAIGIAGGAAMRFHRDGPPDGASFALRHILRHVPEDRRPEAEARLQDARGEIDALRRARRESRAALAEIIAAETFDKAAVTAGILALRTTEDTLRGKTYSTMADLIAELSHEDRIEVAEWIKRLRRGKRGKKGSAKDRD